MIFPCPLCGQRLRAADDAAGKRCRCTKCKELVSIPNTAPAVAPRGTDSLSSQPVPIPLGAKAASVNPPRATARSVPTGNALPVARPCNVPPARVGLAAELDDLIVQKQKQAQQRAEEFAQQRQQHEQQQRKLQARARAAERSNKPAGLPVFVKVLLSSLGVLALFCSGAVGLLYWKNRQPAMVLQVAGYQATAYGKNTDSRNDGTTVAKGVVSQITGSEFWIASVPLPEGTTANIDELKSRFETSAHSVEVVQRGGLQGIKCQGLNNAEFGLFQNLQPEMEFFFVPNQMVFLTYVPGSKKHSAGLQSRALPVDRERRHDDPESFFKSLQPATQSTP